MARMVSAGTMSSTVNSTEAFQAQFAPRRAESPGGGAAGPPGQPSRAAISSAGPSTSFAPSRNNACPPRLRPGRIGPAAAITSRPCSQPAAMDAVMSDPLFSAPRPRPPRTARPLMMRLRSWETFHGSGCVPGACSDTAPRRWPAMRSASASCSADRADRGRSPARDGAPPAVQRRAVRCAVDAAREPADHDTAGASQVPATRLRREHEALAARPRAIPPRHHARVDHFRQASRIATTHPQKPFRRVEGISARRAGKRDDSRG